MTFYPLTHIEIKLHVIFALTSKKAEILQFLAIALFILFVCRPVTNVGGRVSHGGSQFSRGNIENHLN